MADKKKHQDYWTKRVDEIIRYADQIDIDVFAEIARIYLEEAKLVQKELFAFYQRFADDNGLTLQEAMYQLRHEDLSDYQQNAKQYFEQAEKDPELLKRLNEQYASARATRMDLLNLELTWRAGVLATSISSTFENHLLKIAKYAYRKAGDRRGTINEPALRELVRTPINGKNYSEHIWGNVDKLAEDLREVLRRCFIRGLNPREMAQEIAKKYNVARSRAQTIIRTDGTAIISNSVAKRYLDAGLKYYRILVHLDDRTTDICRQIAKENKRYELSEMKAGLNAPPFHYNCRSGIVPDDEELQSDIGIEENDNSVYNKGMERMKRNKDPNKRRPVPIVRQKVLTKSFVERGGIVWQNEEASKYLELQKADAICLGHDTIVLQRKPLVSEILEELYHADQHLRGEIDTNSRRSILEAEIAAQRYLLSVVDKYKIPRSEVRQTQKALKMYQKELEELENEK